MCSFPSSDYFKTFLVRRLEAFAVQRFSECPKYVTIIRHADLIDDSEFHCVPSLPFVGPLQQGKTLYERNFTVPGQRVIHIKDKEFGLFTMLKVLEKENDSVLWLISSVVSRMGFTISNDSDFPEYIRRLSEDES